MPQGLTFDDGSVAGVPLENKVHLLWRRVSGLDLHPVARKGVDGFREDDFRQGHDVHRQGLHPGVPPFGLDPVDARFRKPARRGVAGFRPAVAEMPFGRAVQGQRKGDLTAHAGLLRAGDGGDLRG